MYKTKKGFMMSQAPQQTYLDLYIEVSFSDLCILSYGGGQDSTAILLKLIFDKEFRAKYAPKRLLVIFANTHNEHPYTYYYIDTVIKPLCKAHNIEFVQIDNDMGYHGNTWKSLTGQWENNHPTIGSLSFNATCSHNLKLQPQFRFVEQWLVKNYKEIVNRKNKVNYKQFSKIYGKIRWLVGIARQEESRIADPNNVEVWRKQSIVIEYPLLDVGYNRKDCQNYIESTGYEIPLPSNCMYCPFACNDMEILWLESNYPKQFQKWVQYESKKLAYYTQQYDFVLDYRDEEIKKSKDKKDTPHKIKIIVDWCDNLKMNFLMEQIQKAKEVSKDNKIIRIRVNTYQENSFIEEIILLEKNIKKTKTPNFGVSGKKNKEGEAITLIDFLQRAKQKHPNVTQGYLNDYKASHGHCVTSKY
jgi:hypothetical protein